jgi:hypothetical protein
MKLESVRSLKKEMHAKFVAPYLTEDIPRRRLGIRSLSLDRPSLPNTISLGAAVTGPNSGEYKLAVRVQHPMLWNSPEVESMHKMAHGEIDVRFSGWVRPLQAPWYQETCRPLRMGCSVGHHRITAGTLGAFVVDRNSGAVQILSNNHVLANENQGRQGDDILQPGHADHGQDPRSAVARLARFWPIEFAGINTVDAAVADILQTSTYDFRSLDNLGNLAGGREEPISGTTTVYKIGRTSGRTRGTITAIELDNITVSYNDGGARFDSQIEVEGEGNYAFAQPGDSGSLVVDEARRAVGMVFGGTQQGGSNNRGLIYVNPIAPVLDQLGVDLLW